MKFRQKKKCGKCAHWSGFPYAHCTLGCGIVNTKMLWQFTSKPANPIACRDARQNHFNNL